MTTRTRHSDNSAVSRLGVARIAMTTALSAALLYLLCWTGAVIGVVPVTHRYLQLFTNADLTSTTALIEGGAWSVAFGTIAGALFATIYNALTLLDRRS